MSEAFSSAYLVVMVIRSINLYAFVEENRLFLCTPVQRDISVYEITVAFC